MASEDRFYLMEFRHRPVMWGDIGSAIKIQGLIVGGSGTQAILLLPGEKLLMPRHDIQHYFLTEEEWSDFIRRSDMPEILVGPAKVFQRKIRYEISGAIQQKVWVADSFTCMYCGKQMGEILMTVDHFIPLEFGGMNDTTNYLTSCRPCNKSKGAYEPKAWCEEHGVDYYYLVGYLKQRIIK